MIAQMFASGPCIAAVKDAEGYRAAWYRCDAGKDTIGYGHCRLPGDSYDTVSKAEAEAILIGDLSKFAKQLTPLFARQPTQAQFDAMLSLVYNTGVGYHDGKKGDFADSDLLALFNAGDVAGAANEFQKWVYYHDPETHALTVSQGLSNRRARERAIFLGAAA